MVCAQTVLQGRKKWGKETIQDSPEEKLWLGYLIEVFSLGEVKECVCETKL